MTGSNSLFAETHMPRSSRSKRSSALPPHIANASRELDSKQVIVLDQNGRSGSLACETKGVERLGGGAQVMEDENSFVKAISGSFSGRAIGLMPSSVSDDTIERLLKLESVQKGLKLFIITGGKKSHKGISILSKRDLSDQIVAKVRALVK